jgi:hypothetical protein
LETLLNAINLMTRHIANIKPEKEIQKSLDRPWSIRQGKISTAGLLTICY